MTPRQFFYQHAGYAYDPTTESKTAGRRRCARALAQAEAWAQTHGLTFEWTHDDDANLSWMTPEEQAQPHEVLCCVARYRDGAIAACLGGIIDADDRTYGRVIEAELALEAQAHAFHQTIAASVGAV